MKLRPEQLTEHLKRGLAPVYWLSGDEPLLIQEGADAIRAAARAQGFTERDIFHVDNNFNWDQLLSSANSLSLFAEKKILDVRLNAGKPSADGAAALNEYYTHLSPDMLLLISSPKIDKASQKSNWHKALDKYGTHVEMWPVNAQQMPGWIMARFKQHGLRATPDVGRALAERVEGNLLAASQEIEKLKLLSATQEITLDMLTAVSDHARYDVFVLIDSILLGESARVVKILNGLHAEGTEPSVILWAISRELRHLITIAHTVKCADKKMDAFDSACEKLRIFDKRKPLVRQALRRHPLPQLEAILQKASTIDKSIKGLHSNNPWDGLNAMALHLAGVVTPAALLSIT